MTDKADLRRALKEARATAFAADDPTPALAHLEQILRVSQGPVSFYWPIRTELDPRPVMEKLAGTTEICLPVTHGRTAALTFRAWHPGAELEADGFGVSVPKVDIPVVPHTLVVPLLGFDRRGHRLGYGAGHYDRTLEGLRAEHKISAIGFAYAAQEIAEVPIEPTDQPLDAVVTEAGILRPSAPG